MVIICFSLTGSAVRDPYAGGFTGAVFGLQLAVVGESIFTTRHQIIFL